MSRRKKKNEKRDRLQRAAKKREQLEERSARREQQSEARRIVGMSWLQRTGLDELFKGPIHKKGQAWCVLGVLIGMLLLVVHSLLGPLLIRIIDWLLKLLISENVANDVVVLAMQSLRICWYVAWPVFLSSFFGVFIFRYFEHALEGEAFGRGQAVDETLNVAAASYQTKEVKVHTEDVLKIGPTLRDRMFPLAFLGLPVLWYSLLTAFWFLTPSIYDFSEDTTLIEIGFPFALPVPFVIVGLALLLLPRTFTFDRQAGRLRIANCWKKRVLLLEDVKLLQLIPGQSIQKGSRTRHRPRGTSYSTVQLNLVMTDPGFPRINISHDAERQAASETGLTLSRFLNVPLDDVTRGTQN